MDDQTTSDDELLQAASQALALQREKILKLNEDESDEDQAPIRLGLKTKGDRVDHYICEKEDGGPVRLTSRLIKDQLLEKTSSSHSFGEIGSRGLSRGHFIEEKSNVRTMGPMWSNVPVKELTDDVRHDLQLIRNRAGLDLKRHYKKGILKEIPKSFQIGIVLDDPFQREETKRTRKLYSRALAKDILEDAGTKSIIRKRFKDLQNLKSTFEVVRPDQKKKSRRSQRSKR